MAVGLVRPNRHVFKDEIKVRPSFVYIHLDLCRRTRTAVFARPTCCRSDARPAPLPPQTNHYHTTKPN